MTFNDRAEFSALLEDFEALFSRTRRAGVTAQYFDALKTFPMAIVAEAAGALKLKVTRFPSIAEWFAECKVVAGRRARSTPPASAQLDPPATWGTTANIVVLRAAIRGLRVADPALRARALEIALAELIVLREDHNAPNDVAPARLRAEQDRIVGLLIHQLAREEAAR